MITDKELEEFYNMFDDEYICEKKMMQLLYLGIALNSTTKQSIKDVSTILWAQLHKSNDNKEVTAIIKELLEIVMLDKEE